VNGRLRATALALAAAFAVVGAAPPTPAPAQRFPKATLDDLGSLKLQSENDADASLSGVQIFFGAGLDRQTAAQNGVAALVAECLARTPVDGVALRDAIASRGGSLQYSIDPRAARFYLEARSEALPAMLALFTRALAAPDFSAATIAAARAALSARVNEIEGDARSVALEMFRRSYYSSGAGLPAFGTTASLAALSSDDLTTFYRAQYRRGGVSASAVGAVRPALSTALRGPGDGRSDGQSPAPRTEFREAPAEQQSAPKPERERPPQPSISDLLREGQEIIVQIAKEPLGQKGARITSYVALPGRFVVYMPTVDHVGVSRKIASDEERQRLKRILQSNRTGIPGGFILRTAGEGKTEEELRSDMHFLYNLWMDLRQKAEKKKAPANATGASYILSRAGLPCYR